MIRRPLKFWQYFSKNVLVGRLLWPHDGPGGFGEFLLVTIGHFYLEGGGGGFKGEQSTHTHSIPPVPPHYIICQSLIMKGLLDTPQPPRIQSIFVKLIHIYLMPLTSMRHKNRNNKPIFIDDAYLQGLCVQGFIFPKGSIISSSLNCSHYFDYYQCFDMIWNIDILISW